MNLIKNCISLRKKKLEKSKAAGEKIEFHINERNSIYARLQ